MRRCAAAIFMFDLNTEAGYFYEWNGDFSIIEDDHVGVIRSTYNQKPAPPTLTLPFSVWRVTAGTATILFFIRNAMPPPL